MRRIAKGILAIALGMNVAALGMKLNGSNYAGNLAWDIVSLYLMLQAWIICIAVFIAITFVVSNFAFAEKKEEQDEDVPSPKHIVQHLDPSKAAIQNIQPPKETHKVLIEKPPDPPRELSKEDLKKRVLRELTGRSDI